MGDFDGSFGRDLFYWDVRHLSGLRFRLGSLRQVRRRQQETPEPEKNQSAEIFREKWRAVAEDEEYLRLKEAYWR